MNNNNESLQLIVTIKRVSECVSLKLGVTSFQYCVILYKYSNRYFIKIATVNPPIVHTLTHTHMYIYKPQETQLSHVQVYCRKTRF